MTAVPSCSRSRAAAATSSSPTCRGTYDCRFNINADSRNAPWYVPTARAVVNASGLQRPQAGPGAPHFQQISSSSVKIRVPLQHDSHATPNRLCSTLRAQIAQICGYASVRTASQMARVRFIVVRLKQSGLPESRRPQIISTIKSG